MKHLPDNQDFPDWASFTPTWAAAELPRLLQLSEQSVAELERRWATAASAVPSYEDLVGGLNDATRQLWRCWGLVGHLLSVRNSEDWRKLEEAWQPKIVAFSLRVSQSPALFAAMKACLAALPDGDGSSVRRRILEKTIQAAELSGVGLEGAAKSRFNEIQSRLAKLGSDFHNAVLDATKAFRYEKGGKTYTIDDANYPEIMKHCADSEVRERLYRARTTRAPENNARIDEILALRQESARLLGFPSYAELSLAQKCAPSVAAVFKVIDDLDVATAEKACEEESELLAGGALAPWDRAFAAERLRERKYAYSEEELKRHFELADVVRGLFQMAQFLFGVEVVERVGTAKPAVWHPDVRFFEVREQGETIAHFYFDPFVRAGEKSGGAWMNEFRNRRKTGAAVEMPLAVVVTNFPKPDAAGKSLLPLREVETLFHEFGHALQCMLTRVDEEDAAGISLVEWDAVEVASQFMENWCLDDRTGIVVPAELKRKVRAAKNFRAASLCRRQLAFAKLDMLLHHSPLPLDSAAVQKETFVHFGLPMLPEDRFLCAFTHIFAGGYAAGYYGYKWAEIMSADCYGAFEEAGLADDTAVVRVGRRYRETILALGGSRSALEVFRAFRGRDPEIAAMLRQQDISA